jgi:hypothetical protein
VDSPACTAIVPTRGRPRKAAGLIDAFGQTAVCSELVFCLDDDDPALEHYKALIHGRRAFTRFPVTWHTGPRQHLAGWTNQLAAVYAPQREALISLGDDHMPVTPAWDRELLDAARAMGGGWVYGDDGVPHQDVPAGWVTSRLPTAFLVSSKIAAGLGWMLGPPGCDHMFVDAAARDLALAASDPPAMRLAYLPRVKVLHDHWTTGRSGRDQTYDGGQACWPADEATYRAWLGDPPGSGPIAEDADTVRRACA